METAVGRPYFSVVNWEHYQHYKDRNPPWIKFYNALLDDFDFVKLPDDLKWAVCGCMLLASRLDNRIPYDAEYVKSRIFVKRLDLQQLTDTKFFVVHDASTTLEQRERQRESRDRGRAETEGETEGKPGAENPPAADRPIDGFGLLDIFNEHRGGLPECLSLTTERRQKALVRLRGRRFPTLFTEAVKRAAHLPFCLGENERGWKLSFDFLIANDTNAVKVLEGKYDHVNRTKTKSERTIDAGREALRDLFDEIDQRDSGSGERRNPEGNSEGIRPRDDDSHRGPGRNGQAPDDSGVD